MGKSKNPPVSFAAPGQPVKAKEKKPKYTRLSQVPGELAGLYWSEERGADEGIATAAVWAARNILHPKLLDVWSVMQGEMPVGKDGGDVFSAHTGYQSAMRVFPGTPSACVELVRYDNVGDAYQVRMFVFGEPNWTQKSFGIADDVLQYLDGQDFQDDLVRWGIVVL